MVAGASVCSFWCTLGRPSCRPLGKDWLPGSSVPTAPPQRTTGNRPQHHYTDHSVTLRERSDERAPISSQVYLLAPWRFHSPEKEKAKAVSAHPYHGHSLLGRQTNRQTQKGSWHQAAVVCFRFGAAIMRFTHLFIVNVRMWRTRHRSDY